MNIKIWDNYNKQWLEPISIFFGKDNTIYKVSARKPNENALRNGWYDFEEENLKHIAIIGDLNFNTELIIKHLE